MTDVGRDGLYDCGFLDAAGKFVGLTLTRNKNRGLNYVESTDSALAQQFFTGTPGYSNLEPEKEIQIGQGDWRSGFGQEYYDSDDPKRYYESTNIDARFKDMIICGPAATGIALTDYSATITDGGLEIWTNNTLTNWPMTGSGSHTLTKEGTTTHGDSDFSAKFSTQTTGRMAITQSPTWNTKYQGVRVKVSVYVYQDTANHIKLRVFDGEDTTDGDASATTGSWVQLTVTHTVHATLSDELTISAESQNMGATCTTYIDDFAWVAPVLGAPLALHEFQTSALYIKLYLAYGDVLVKLNSTYNGWDFVYNFVGNVITDLEVFGDYLYIALGTSAPYNYMNTSDGMLASELVGDKGKAYWFGVVGATFKKVLSNSAYTVYSAVSNDPTNNGDWDSGTTIGSSTYYITGKVIDQAGTPIVPKQDYPWYIDGDGNDQGLIPSLKSEYDFYSCRNIMEWKGNIYIPCGKQSLYEYSESGVVTNISPADYITGSSQFDGQIQALASDARYLFAFIDNGTEVEILAGHWETIAGTTSWVWHPISQITFTGGHFALTQVARAVVLRSTTTYVRRLWILSTDEDDEIHYIPLTVQYGNITSDSDYSFQADGNIITPYMHADFKGDDKAFYKITLTMPTASEDDYFEAWYQMLGGNWTDIGDFQTSPTTTKYLPVELTTEDMPTSKFIRFKFIAKTDNGTPVLSRWDVRAVWYPVQRDIIYIQVRVADGIKLHNELSDETQSAASIRTAIDAWANPTTAWPRAFYPPYYASSSDTKYCKLLPPVTQKQVEDEITRTSEWVYDLQLLVVDGLSF